MSVAGLEYAKAALQRQLARRDVRGSLDIDLSMNSVGDGICDLLQIICDSQIEEVNKVFLFQAGVTHRSKKILIAFMAKYPNLSEFHFSDNQIDEQTAVGMINAACNGRNSRFPLWLRLDRCGLKEPRKLMKSLEHIVCTNIAKDACRQRTCLKHKKIHCPPGVFTQ